MRRLRVDIDEIASAMDNSSYELHFYLDLETGKVEMLTEEERSLLEDSEVDFDDDELAPDAARALDEADLPQWQRESLAAARQVLNGFGTRYIAIPRQDGHEAYQDMERFISTVRNPQLQDRLFRAISGRGAFRYFKDVLYDHPAERERWFAFRDEQARQRVLEWLESEDIEPIEERE